ncbi:MAG: SCO family protein [Planctomycetes bacterium]|nr:SCO family protein [Planctomycetota bacterium]
MGWHAWFSAAAAAAVLSSPGSGQTTDLDPPDADEVGIVERLNQQVPLDVRFTAENGASVTLGEYFNNDRPVVLTLVYYNCPSLCNALLNSFTGTLKEIDWTAGEEFEIVTVSIDPSETAQLAAGKKREYLQEYGRPEAAGGWHFLVGRQPEIQRLAEAVGFGYRYEEGTGLYTHAAGLMILTPDGRLSRYLTDLIFEPQTLRLALVEAAEGTIGTPVQRLLLRFCYTYDPSAGKYVVAARKVMAIGGGLTVLVVLFGLGLLWRRELKTRRSKTTMAGVGS